MPRTSSRSIIERVADSIAIHACRNVIIPAPITIPQCVEWCAMTHPTRNAIWWYMAGRDGKFGAGSRYMLRIMRATFGDPIDTADGDVYLPGDNPEFFGLCIGDDGMVDNEHSVRYAPKDIATMHPHTSLRIGSPIGAMSDIPGDHERVGPNCADSSAAAIRITVSSDSEDMPSVSIKGGLRSNPEKGTYEGDYMFSLILDQNNERIG